MNTQGKNRISLRDQYWIETELNSHDHIARYADWLEKKMATEYIHRQTGQRYGEYCKKVEKGIDKGVWEMSIDDYTRIYGDD